MTVEEEIEDSLQVCREIEDFLKKNKPPQTPEEQLHQLESKPAAVFNEIDFILKQNQEAIARRPMAGQPAEPEKPEEPVSAVPLAAPAGQENVSRTKTTPVNTPSVNMEAVSVPPVNMEAVSAPPVNMEAVSAPPVNTEAVSTIPVNTEAVSTIPVNMGMTVEEDFGGTEKKEKKKKEKIKKEKVKKEKPFRRPKAEKESKKAKKESVVLEDDFSAENNLTSSVVPGEEAAKPEDDNTLHLEAVSGTGTDVPPAAKHQKKNLDSNVEEGGSTEEYREKHPFLRVVCSIGICVAAALVLALVITKFVAHHTSVEGNSMEPSLSNGDQLIVEELSYYFSDPERFDVVVFPFSDEVNYIKRIIGKPGEVVQIVDSEILINGVPLLENFGKEAIEDPGIAKEEIVLGEDEYFVLGDNRNASVDSRKEEVGVVKRSQIEGKAWLRFYPFGRFSFVQ